MKRVFKTRYFARWMHKTLLSNEALCKSIAEMERGLVDADGCNPSSALGAGAPLVNRKRM
jgi:hypothetical protein